MLIGLLRNYKVPEAKDRVAALNIKEFGHQAIFFSINDVDFEKKEIKCKNLENGKWVETISCYPDVVYNDLPPVRKADPKLYKKLEDEGIPFTTHRLGLDKARFTEIMKKNPYLHKYMIETINSPNVEEFKAFLDKHKSIVLKPNRGHKGLGVSVYEIDDKEKLISIENHDGVKELIKIKEMEKHLDKIDLRLHHLQKKVTSYTKNNLPFIIRSYVGKNGKGKWMNMFNYAAVSTNANNVVNVSRGSGLCFFKEFCEDNYGKDAEFYREKIKKSCIEVAEAVQKEFSFEIDALGLDYALTEEGDLYLYEVNTFPGTRPYDALVQFHAVQFAMYLYNKKS